MKSVRLCEKVRFCPKFRKLQEATWLPVINEIFKFPRHSDPFCQLNYLLKSLQATRITRSKIYTWDSFQTSRKGFCKLQEPVTNCN